MDNGTAEIIEIGQIKIELTTTINQENMIDDNKTSIDFGECEALLRSFYNISNDNLLYVRKVDIIQEKMKIPKIKYDLYNKINGTNLMKLNLSICENSKLSILVPVEINEDLDILNGTSGYYNDICYNNIRKWNRYTIKR